MMDGRSDNKEDLHEKNFVYSFKETRVCTYLKRGSNRKMKETELRGAL
jgi:hypothetical protein